jgi:hypothetical protein
MAWLSIIQSLVSLLSTFTSWLSNQQLIDAGKAEAISAHLQGAIDEIRTANTVREQVRTDVAADPGSVRLPNKFSRD